MLALVTGAGGFVGRGIIEALLNRGWRVRAAVRDSGSNHLLPRGVEVAVAGALETAEDLPAVLEGVDVVFHCAGRAHSGVDSKSSTEELYRLSNVEATRRLARAAGRGGVKRLVFFSSVKAMGEATALDEIWDEKSPCRPRDCYGRSKLEAEAVLMEESASLGLEAVILRLPLVYGPGFKANMRLLWRAVDSGWPLPLAYDGNLRSFLFLGNLVDAAILAGERPSAAGETFLVSDGHDLSSAELARRIAKALGRPSRVWALHPSFLRLAARCLGRSEMADRLLGSLRVSNAKITGALGWIPPFDINAGFLETACWYKSREASV